MRNHQRLFVLVTVLSLLLAGLWGCAMAPTHEELQKSLLTRAELYWKLRMGGEYEATYKMEDPEGLPAYGPYKAKAGAMFKIRIVSYEVRNPVVEGESGTVDVEFGLIMPPVTTTLKQVMKERWVFRNGQWRHVFPK